MIKIEHVHIHLPDFNLQNINLAIHEGEFFILLGPTGSGKTIILEAIAGLVPVTNGCIKVRGRNITDLPPEQRGIGIVYQDYALFPHLSVYDNITYGLRYQKSKPREAQEWVVWLMEELNIRALAHRSTGNLSGGEKQRIALARALAVHPSVLLLDEPLSSLDPNFREGIRDLLKKLHQDLEVTFLMVTHNFTEALVLGDRTAILNNGRIEQVGSVSQVFQQPATPFVAEFVGMKNIFPAVFKDTKAIVNDLELQLAISPEENKQYVGIRAEDIFIIGALSSSNGDNVFEGKIENVSNRGLYHEVSLNTGNVTFTAMITRSVVFEMNLLERKSIYFTIKPSDIHVF